MTKAKQKGNPKFSFLFGGDHYSYYTYRVNAEQAILRLKTPQPQMGYPHPQQQIGYPQQQQPLVKNEWPQQQPQDPWATRTGPRALMDAKPYPGPSGLSAPGVVIPQHLGSAPVIPDVEKLQTQISEASTQIHTLQEQIKQSEMNLAAQKEVTRAQVEGATFEAIQSAKREHLELLANDTGMDLEEMDTGRIQS